MGLSQIVAVDHVNLQADPGVEPDLVWLYRDVVGLALIEASSTERPCVRFKSGDIELRYGLVPEPNLEPVACRLTVEVPSLTLAEASLIERGIQFERIRGLNHTDRRYSLLDPAGNRIEIKQQWLQRF